jgi:hypothetical protein
MGSPHFTGRLRCPRQYSIGIDGGLAMGPTIHRPHPEERPTGGANARPMTGSAASRRMGHGPHGSPGDAKHRPVTPASQAPHHEGRERGAANCPCASINVRYRGRAEAGCVGISSLHSGSRTLSPCDPIFFHHTAILWARLRGVLAADRSDGSRPSPSDDIGRKETPMNSTSTPKSVESHDAVAAREAERLAHAHEEIKRADEQLARLSEQVARMERGAAPLPSAGSGPQSPPKRPTLRVLLLLAACIVVAALVLQSSFSGGPRVVVARWAPQVASTPSLPPENPPFPAPPAPSIVQVAAAEPAPPQPAPTAQTVPQDAVPPTTAALPDHTQLLQTMARDLANMERSIEQLKANQQQIASASAKEIAELKASQEELKRALAKVSGQDLPKALPPPAPPAPASPAPTLRKPERTLQSPQARARPRFRREWMYDDYW